MNIILSKFKVKLANFSLYLTSKLVNFNYSKDGLYTLHNVDFLKKKSFLKAYKKGKQTKSWGSADIEWRVHICLWICSQSLRLKGDFIECGTNRGGMTMSILTYLGKNPLFTKKKFYCFDTFSGLSSKYSSQIELKNLKGIYQDCFEEVRRTFSKFPQVVLVKGAIPESLRNFKSPKVAFLHIDMNAAKAEIEAINFFWDHLESGAYILLDDFAWEVCYEQRKAFVKFAYEKKVELLWLPTGQGLIQKP
jgi:O-methyltransferase